MTVNERLRAVRKALDLTQTEFGASLPATQSYLGAIERGDRDVTEKILKLVVLQYNVNEHWLRTGEGGMFSATPSAIVARVVEEYGLDSLEAAVLTSFLSLPAQDREGIKQYVRKLVEAVQRDQTDETTPPVLTRARLTPSPRPARQPQRRATKKLRKSLQSASAGYGVYLGPEEFEEIEVPADLVPDSVVFSVPVSGDSMEPTYSDGDLLLVSKEEPRIGEVGVFTLDGEGYVKERGAKTLIPLNPGYPIIALNDSVRCNGKVVGKLSPQELTGHID